MADTLTTLGTVCLVITLVTLYALLFHLAHKTAQKRRRNLRVGGRQGPTSDANFVPCSPSLLQATLQSQIKLSSNRIADLERSIDDTRFFVSNVFSKCDPDNAVTLPYFQGLNKHRDTLRKLRKGLKKEVEFNKILTTLYKNTLN